MILRYINSIFTFTFTTVPTDTQNSPWTAGQQVLVSVKQHKIGRLPANANGVNYQQTGRLSTNADYPLTNGASLLETATAPMYNRETKASIVD